MPKGIDYAKFPTSNSKKLTSYIVGFTVAVGIGLAPFLGKLDIPFFSPLLDLIPSNIQNVVIPLSSFLMGIVVVFIEWLGGEKVTKMWLRKSFFYSIFLVLFSVVSLTTVHTMSVVQIPINGGQKTVSFIVGFTRPANQHCSVNLSDAECIKKITFDTSKIESVWGDGNVRISKLALIFSYLFCLSSFGLIIGNTMLKLKQVR